MSDSYYIRSKLYDRLFLIYIPLIAFCFVAAIVPMRNPGESFLNPPNTPVWLISGASFIIFMHVTLVFVRSHFNQTVYSKYPIRFTLIPIVIFLALALNNNLYLLVIPITYIWDEMHSALQTFGLGRIYDSKLGNNPLVGRRLDMGLCFFIEYYPHITRMMILPHDEFVKELEVFGSYTQIIYELAPKLVSPMVLIGICYILFYTYRYYKLVQGGYKISSNKVLIYTLTGGVTIFTVCNYSIIEALIIGNLYHSIQYFAIIWFMEKKNIIKKLKLTKLNYSYIFGIFIVGTSIFMLALLRLSTESITFDITNNLPIFGAFWLTTSILHFWYDGFIWSVRRKEV